MSQVHSRCNKGEHSESMQYFYMYVLGVLKSSVINPPQIMNPIDTVDRVNHMRFLAMQMSPDEMLQLFSPQVMCISVEGLNGQEFPPLEVLERKYLRQDAIYLLYNSFAIYMFVGRQADPFYLADIFKVENF